MVFKQFFVAIAMVFSLSAAMADWVATQPGAAVTARKTACPASVLKHIPEQYHKDFRKAEGLIDGVSYLGCWMQMDDMIVVIWEDGDYGMIPVAEFREIKEV